MQHAVVSGEAGLVHSLRDRVLAWWQEKQSIARDLHELSKLEEHGLETLAADVGINPQLLVSVIRHGPNAAEDMNALMRALNIDPDAVHFEEPSVYRALRVSCALCPDKSRCRHELAQGTAQENYAHFCPNHNEMSELRARPEFQVD